MTIETFNQEAEHQSRPSLDELIESLREVRICLREMRVEECLNLNEEALQVDHAIWWLQYLRPCDRCGKPPATNQVTEICSVCDPTLLCIECYTLHQTEVQEEQYDILHSGDQS